MTPRPVTPSPGVHTALASPVRRRLLELLRGDETVRDVHDLGRAVGLHSSTVRFHLETLCRAGLVTRTVQQQDGIGRPRTAYVAVRDTVVDMAGHGYESLARLLAADLAETGPARGARAERMGAQWAQQLIPAPAASVTTDEASMRVSELFGRLGFGPELRTVDAGREIRLHACPFRSVARDHPDVVCALHRGLLRESLSRLGTSGASRLLPFVEPELCLVEIDS